MKYTDEFSVVRSGSFAIGGASHCKRVGHSDCIYAAIVTVRSLDENDYVVAHEKIDEPVRMGAVMSYGSCERVARVILDHLSRGLDELPLKRIQLEVVPTGRDTVARVLVSRKFRK